MRIKKRINRILGVITSIKKLFKRTERLQAKFAYRNIFDMDKPATKIVLADLIMLCGDGTTYEAGSPIDPLKLARNAGRMEVLQHIFEMREIKSEDLEVSLENTEEM